jgi:hypothetical protein
MYKCVCPPNFGGATCQTPVCPRDGNAVNFDTSAVLSNGSVACIDSSNVYRYASRARPLTFTEYRAGICI